MNVANRKCVRHLSFRSLLANRTRNLVAVLAIVLTTVLFTSLFTIALSINEGIQQNNFRQAGGWSHGTFKYLTEEQFEKLKDDPLIESWGLRRFLGMPTDVPFNKSHVEVGYSDANEAHWCYCDPIEGRLPKEGTDEAATDTHVLELLGVEPKLGAKFTVTFEVDGHETTQTFTLCGWWEYDEAVVANHILIPESRVDAVLQEVGVTPPGSDGMTGEWNLDVMLKNGARSISKDLNEILANHGYQSETAGADYIALGVNWGYTGAQLSDKLDPTVVAIIAGVLALILLTGYLIIYNVFQISVAGDIRFYGLLKTIGTTQRDHRGLGQSPPLCGCGNLRPGDRAHLLPPPRPLGGQGLPGGGGALHRGEGAKAERQAERQGGVPAVHGLGQSGPQPGQDLPHGAVPDSCCGAADPDRDLRQWV